jgi:hypothetical protein
MGEMVVLGACCSRVLQLDRDVVQTELSGSDLPQALKDIPVIRPQNRVHGYMDAKGLVARGDGPCVDVVHSGDPLFLLQALA